MLDYRIDIFDTWGRHIAGYDEVPLLEATRTSPDEPDTVRGLLPESIANLGHGYRIRVTVGDRLFVDAPVVRVSPQWSDSRKLILDRYVPFHEIIEFEAERSACEGNNEISLGCTNQSVSQIVRDAINRAAGPIHYTVEHTAYPDGAQREYQKFLARKSHDNELEVGGITRGQWVGADRIDTSNASARSGDTISGLIVDGVAWPDVRLMMIGVEQTARDAAARERHPEVVAWTDAQYAASGYKQAADASAAGLDTLLREKGIAFIELNPHRDITGAFDDRVDAEGRYLGFVYGGGESFNAAQIECGHADVCLRAEGKCLDPAMALKEYYSYAGVARDSIADCGVVVHSLDIRGGLMPALTALAYMADGFVWSVSPDLAVTFRQAALDQVLFADPLRMGVCLGSSSVDLTNMLHFSGNPLTGGIDKTYYQPESVDAYGLKEGSLFYFSVSTEADADRLAAGVLADIAYPEQNGFITLYGGSAHVEVGDLVEVRGERLRRFEREVENEWNDLFKGKHVFRVGAVTQRFSGRDVSTVLWLTSPLRSVRAPLSFIARGQESAQSLYQFRLDEATVGLDMGYHMD